MRYLIAILMIMAHAVGMACAQYSNDTVFTSGLRATQFNASDYYFCDEFTEAAAAIASTVISKCNWTGGGTSGGQAIVAGIGGWMELDTTSTGNRTSTLTYTTANFSGAYAPALEFRFKTNNITNTKIDAGWYVDGNDEFLIRFNTATNANNIYLVTENNNGGEVLYDTGVDLVAATWYTVRLEINATTLTNNATFQIYINGDRVAAESPLATTASTIRSLATFKPYFYVDNKASAEQKLLDIDYVKIWQKRS